MLREVLTVSALILAVLLVRAIFKNRVPKRMVYTLWLVVLVKLCLPGTLVSLRRLWRSRRHLCSSQSPRRRRPRKRPQSR